MKLHRLLGFSGIGILSLVFYWPLVQLLRSATMETTPSWDGEGFWRILRFTYLQAGVSTALGALIGVPLALVVSDGNLPGRRTVWSLSLLNFTLPAVVMVNAVVLVWGNGGFFTNVLGIPALSYGWSGILLCHTAMNFPLFLKNIALALRDNGRTEELSALSLGASRFRTFWAITLPKISGSLLETILVSFLLCSSSFLVVLLLGGGPRYSTLEVAIYQAVRVELDVPLASRLALFQLGIGTLIAIPLYLRNRGSSPSDSEWIPIFFARRPILRRGTTIAVWALVLIVVGVPLALLLWNGLVTNVPSSIEGVLNALSGSFKLAFLTAVFSICLSFSLSYFGFHGSRKWSGFITVLTSVPMQVSAILISLAWILTFPNIVFGHRGSLLLIAVIQAIGILPITTKIICGALERIPENLIHTARSLGASELRLLWNVELPLVKSSLMLALVLSIGYSFGEVGSQLMLLDENLATLPLYIYRLMGSYRFSEASFTSALLVVVVGVIFTITQRIEKWA